MIEVIPAIDLIDGKCVRLSQGDYSQIVVYNNDPLEVAKRFEAAGVTRLHLVDLDGAKAQHIVNHKVLERIAVYTNLIIDFGGGLKSDEDVQIAFDYGAQMITGGSIAVKSPETLLRWITTFGADQIILGADVKEEKIAVSGWTEQTDLEWKPFIQNYMQHGLDKVICTDISRDGMLQGPSIELYRQMLAQLPDVYLIASGGVSSFADLRALEEIGIPAVIVGKAFYEGKISLKEISRLLL